MQHVSCSALLPLLGSIIRLGLMLQPAGTPLKGSALGNIEIGHF
jgi:hypothetical protein